MTVDLRVLGSLRLSASDGRDLESLIRQAKRMAVLAYLAAAVPRGFQRRDTLLALFWPDSDDAHARSALSQALYVLRNALGEQGILTRGDGEVGLNADVVTTDVGAFEAALDAGRPAEALALYGGDLLEGFFITGAPEFERWLETARGRLRHRASEGAWALAEAKAAAGATVEAARWARRAAELLPADEAGVRRLMAFLHRLGDRAAAMRAYEAFAWRLTQEYELEPSTETRALAAALREEERQPALQFVELGSAPLPAILVAMRRRLPLAWVAASAIIVVGVAASLWAWLGRPELSSRPVVRFALQFPGGRPITSGIPGSPIALSPDGRLLVYLAERGERNHLFLRAMDQLESVPIAHTRGSQQPFFSPDGKWLGFVADGAIRKVPLTGGPAVAVCNVGTNVLGASWGSNDTILFATTEALWQVPASGGVARALIRSDTARGVAYRWPDLLPGGRAAVLTLVDRSGFQLAAVSLEPEGDTVRLLGRAGTSPRFVAPGYLVFAQPDGALLAAPFDRTALTITGPAFLVTSGVTVGLHGAAKLGSSRTGVLAHVPEQFADRALVMLDRGGAARMLSAPLQATSRPASHRMANAS